MMLVVYIFTNVIIFLKSLQLLYFFQIKEYRLDRFYSFLKEYGPIQLLLTPKKVVPAKTARNLLAAAIIFVLVVSILVTRIQLNWPENLIYLLLSPVIAFLLTFIAVLITAVPAHFRRQTIIAQAKQKVKRSKTVFIGVTGSYGKTSVKEFLYHILRSKYKVGKTDKNMNTDVGIGLSILKNLHHDTDYFIIEYGAYQHGEIRKEIEIAKPSYSILTGLGNQHLDLYGSRKNLIDEETYILQILTPEQTAYINLDFPESREVTRHFPAKKVYYSLHQPADISVKHLTVTLRGTTASIQYQEKTFDISTRLLGKHSILNILPCIALAFDLGMQSEEIRTAIESLDPLQGRLSLHTKPNGSAVLNDTYNSNVNGFISAIQLANSLPFTTKIVISKGIIELGVEKRASYKTILEELDKADIQLITDDQLFRELDTRGKVRILSDVYSLNSQELLTQPNTLFILEGRMLKTFINTFIAV